MDPNQINNQNPQYQGAQPPSVAPIQPQQMPAPQMPQANTVYAPNANQVQAAPPVSGQPMAQPIPGQINQPLPMPNNMPAPQVQLNKNGPPEKPNTNPNSTQNSLLIAEIRDGIVIMNDGSFRSVVMCKSINFDLMSPEEREAVEFSYQGFLNSLYFPVQIFVRSKKVDMRPYLEKLTKLKTSQDNMLLALLMDDYINFIELLAQETNIMDKQFYVTVPYYPNADTQKAVEQSKNFITSFLKPKTPHQLVHVNAKDLEEAKTELTNRVQSVMSGLQQLGVQSIPLDTEELIELYYDSYNPDTATRQQIRNYSNLTAQVITKGQGVSPYNQELS